MFKSTALFGLTATMTRVAASSQGFRLPRMYLDRLAKAVALPVAAVGAAVSAPTGVAEGVPAALAAVVVVIAVALSDLVRIVYWAVRRRRLFRRPASSDVESGTVGPPESRRQDRSSLANPQIQGVCLARASVPGSPSGSVEPRIAR